MDKPITTLFMLMSVDGKISTGTTNKMDIEKDFRLINGVKEGLQQYYDIEKTTDPHSLNSGKVMAKIGANTNKFAINCPNVSFIIIDNNYLTLKGVNNLVKNTKKLYLITSNQQHPVFKISNSDNLEIIYYKNKINFKALFKKLKKGYKINRLTIQSGGTLNSIILRENLIDYISIVIAPCIIGGKNTSTLIDGKDLFTKKDLNKIKSLKLKDLKKSKNSYLHLIYEVKKI